MYWVTDPMLAGFAETEGERFVQALPVFSSKHAASEYARHNPGVKRTKEITGAELADLIELYSDFRYVVVNPLPYPPSGSRVEDVRPVENFLEGLRL